MKNRLSTVVVFFVLSFVVWGALAGCTEAGSPGEGTNNEQSNNETTNNAECEPDGVELCDDGIDNDCDGEVDEGFDDLGAECTSGVGVCETAGVLVCSQDLTTLECGEMPAQPEEADEMTCDGLDNDCDGEVDEGCDDDGDGYCDSDMMAVDSPEVCPNGGGDCDDDAASAFPGAPGICGDGIDNDCDGGVDNFVGADRTDPTWGLSGIGVSSNDDDTPSIMATPIDGVGFCVAAYDSGTNDVAIGILNIAEDSFDFEIRSLTDDPTRLLQDIAWDGTSCGVVYTSELASMESNQLDVDILRYEQGGSTIHRLQVADQRALQFKPKFAGLTSDGSDWLVAYGVQGNNSYYRTVPADFTLSSTPSSEFDIGNAGIGFAFGPSPNPADDFLLSLTALPTFVYAINAGSDGRLVEGLDFGLGDLNLWIEEVGGSVYHIGTTDGETNVFEILESYELGNTGTVEYATETSQEEVARSVTTTGPQDSKWYIDPFGDVAYIFEDDGTEITFELQSHPNLTGELLAVVTIGDEVVVLALSEAGTSGSMTRPATVVAYSYTCS